MRGKDARQSRLGIDDLVEKAHAKGLHVNNLFEIGGRWRANVTDKTRFFEFGEGRTLTKPALHTVGYHTFTASARVAPAL